MLTRSEGPLVAALAVTAVDDVLGLAEVAAVVAATSMSNADAASVVNAPEEAPVISMFFAAWSLIIVNVPAYPAVPEPKLMLVIPSEFFIEMVPVPVADVSQLFRYLSWRI